MEIEEHNTLIRLFDLYGKLLSKKQQEVMDKHLNLDLGESELAELIGGSRQSVHDAVSTAKKQLFMFEKQCGLLSLQLENEKFLQNLSKLIASGDLASAKREIDKKINK